MTKPLAALCALFLAACTTQAPSAPAPVPLASASTGAIAEALAQTPRPNPSEPPSEHADIAGTLTGVVQRPDGLGAGFSVDSPGHEWDDISVGVGEATVIWVPDGDIGYRRGSVADLVEGRLVRVWLGPFIRDTGPPGGDGFEVLLLRPGTNGALSGNAGGLISNASPTPSASASP